MLSRRGKIADSHTERQADPVRPSLWWAFEKVLAQDDIFAVAICCLWVMLITTVVRPKHCLMSVVKLLPDRFEGFCCKGKAKIQGARRPFRWASPRLGLSGIDLGKTWERIQSASGAGTDICPGLLMDFTPSRTGLDGITGFADSPMSRARFLRFSAEVFKRYDFPDELVRIIEGLYSGRRVLPTLADAASYGDVEKLDTGGWFDKNAASRSAMPHRYSSARLFVQASLKHSLVQSAAVAFQTFRALPEYKSAMDVTPEWEQLFLLRPKGRISLNSKRDDEQRVEESVNVIRKEDQTNNDDTYSESEPSESSADSEPATSVFTAPQLSIAISWELASGPKGRLHLHGLDGLVCKRKELRLPERGTGIVAAAATSRRWSPRCFEYLHTELRQWWEENAVEGDMQAPDS